MRIYFLLFLILLCIFLSCQSKDGNPIFGKLKWESLDSVVSYHIINNSSDKLTPTDSVSIDFIGKLNKDGSLGKSNFDSLAGEMFSQYQFGVFLNSDSILKKSLKVVLLKMKKNNTAYIKWHNENGFDLASQYSISAFLNNNISEKTALELCEKLKREDYIISVNYLSSEKAIEKYMDDNDSLWIQLIKLNPLPASIEFTTKKKYFNKIALDSIGDILNDKGIFSEIKYPQTSLFDFIKDYSINAFIVKIRTH